MTPDPDAPAELPLIIGAGGGEAEWLLLVGRPVGGQVQVRRWSSGDWGAGTSAQQEDAAALLRWIEAQAAAGRTVNQSLYAVRLWLRGEAGAPRSR